jgi:hypothetical protein
VGYFRLSLPGRSRVSAERRQLPRFRLIHGLVVMFRIHGLTVWKNGLKSRC